LAAAVSVAVLSTAALPALGQTNNSYPMLTLLHPVAVQAGASVEADSHSYYSQWGANQVRVFGKGVRGEVVNTEWKRDDNGNKPGVATVRLKMTADADAPLGPRDFRVHTPQGASTVGQLVVVRDPVIVEKPDNNTVDKATPVELPATICGILNEAEDVDMFKFHVEAGAELTFHVWCQRLQRRIHDLQTHADPIITVRNLNGGVIASVDNTFAGDPLLQHRFERAGDYILEIRDVRYQNNPYWGYAIEVHTRPFVTQLYPPAVSLAEEQSVEMIGPSLAAGTRGLVHVDGSMKFGRHWFTPKLGGQFGNATPGWVSALPLTLESPVQNDTVAVAQPVSFPIAICGRLETPGDIDCYSFERKAGENYDVTVIARRVQSRCDPSVRVLNATGAAYLDVDDAVVLRESTTDVQQRGCATPVDGIYTLEIRDLNYGGGPDYVYCVLLEPSKPMFELVADQDKVLLAPGVSTPLFVQALRHNGFNSEIQLAVEGVPAGVTVECGKIVPGRNEGVLIFKAGPEAVQGMVPLKVSGTAIPVGDAAAKVSTEPVVAEPKQEVYMPGGGRFHRTVDEIVLSVAEPMDIRNVTISTPSITIKPGESQKIEVTVERSPDYKGNVSLDVIYQHLEQNWGNSLPQGVAMDVSASKTLLGPGESEGYIVLKASPDAPETADQLSCVIAHVSINFVMKHTWCQPLRVTVAR
jgi:hypothetical protein